MANKYIIHGATYCGDGTASNEAASAGAAGAWNDINVFTGTAPAYGALAAGDIVYIRSKSSSGANITVSYPGGATYYFGSAAATSWTAPITWVIDNGSVWSGVDGVVTFTLSSTVFAYSFRQYNRFVCKTKSSLVVEALGEGSSWSIAWGVSGDLHGVRFRMPNKVSSGNGDMMLSNALLNDCSLDYGRFIQNGTIGVDAATYNVVMNLTINALYATPSSASVFGQANASDTDSAQLYVIGGSLSGVGATTGLSLANLTNRGRVFEFVNFRYPNTVAPIYGTPHKGNRLSVFGADGASGSVLNEQWGYVDSRQDGYYPTLNATYPRSDSLPWSYKVYPVNVAQTMPARVVVSTLYTGDAGSKTVTLNLLVADNMTSVSKENTFAIVSYIDDATGNTVSLTTRATGDLDASTAGWSTTTYGPINFLKRLMSVVTPTAIRKDTLVTVAFITYAKSASANDILFIDPAVVLT